MIHLKQNSPLSSICYFHGKHKKEWGVLPLNGRAKSVVMSFDTNHYAKEEVEQLGLVLVGLPLYSILYEKEHYSAIYFVGIGIEFHTSSSDCRQERRACRTNLTKWRSCTSKFPGNGVDSRFNRAVYVQVHKFHDRLKSPA